MTPDSDRRRMLAMPLAIVALIFLAAAPVRAAGESSAGVIVKATNPATSQLGSDLDLSLTAHTAASPVEDPSCRPQDANIECWGSLLLRIPKFGDLSVGRFEVHRVAVGDIGCGDEGDDGCGDDAATLAPTTTLPVLAQVNGIAFVKWPGNTGLPVGTKLQVKLTLTDNGTVPYGDQVIVEVRRFVEGPDKPLLYRSGPEIIRQVQIRWTSEG